MKIVFKDEDGRVVHADPENDTYQVIAERAFNCLLGTISFQNGDPALNGTNGLTNELLISILIDRITRLNIELPCEENLTALSALNEAKTALSYRAVRRKNEMNQLIP